VTRPLGTDEQWLAPTLEVFHDFMGHVETAILGIWAGYAPLLEWTSVWGHVGMIGLHSDNSVLLNEFRTLLTMRQMQGMEFNTFPKEAMLKLPELTCVIKSTLRTFNIAFLPRALFLRNPDLNGTLQVTHVKRYDDSEVSRAGTSKKGWRIVVLRGDQELLQSLESFHDNHVFNFSSHGVQLRGGKRKSGNAPNNPASGTLTHIARSDRRTEAKKRREPASQRQALGHKMPRRHRQREHEEHRVPPDMQRPRGRQNYRNSRPDRHHSSSLSHSRERRESGGYAYDDQDRIRNRHWDYLHHERDHERRHDHSRSRDRTDEEMRRDWYDDF